MNGLSASSKSPNLQIPPPDPISDPKHLSYPTTRPEFLSFKFKTIGQPPTLLSRLADVSATSDYRSPPLELSDMEMSSSDDPPMIIPDEPRALQPASRKSLLDMLGGTADQSHHQKPMTTQTQESGVSESMITAPSSAPPPKSVLPRPESRMSSIARQTSGTADAPRVDPASPRAPAPPEIHAHDPQDLEMIDIYADPDSPSPSPFSLFSELTEAVRESADLERITVLHRALTAEREELLRRHEEATRALSRTKSQLDHVLSLTDEAFQMTAVFVGKEKARLETKKTKAEAKIEHRKNLEAEQRRKAKELERIRQQEEERKVQIEMEQQAERQRLEERRKEEALAAERQRLEEIQAKEAEERRRLEEERSRIEEEERLRLAEERRRRDEEERKRQAEEQKEEERIRRQLAEKEATARRQEEDKRTQLFERRKLAEDDRRRKETEAAAAAKAEAERQAAEKEQQRIFQERRATALKDKYKNYSRPEPGPPSAGSSSSTFEGTQGSNLPAILVNDVPKNPQVAEHHPGLTKSNRIREPTFVPAATEAGRLLPDLSRRVIPDSGAVKHETTSPVITPVDSVESTEGTPPTPPMSTTALAPTSATLPPAPHLPTKPATIYSRPPRGRYPSRRSTSRSRSRSPRSRSPEPHRSRYSPPPLGRGDHYSPRYSDSPSPPPINPRKRALHDSWDRADTPSKLDYSHPSKRRTATPLRSRSPPSPRTRPLMQPPQVVSARRPPPTNRRGRGGPLPLEQRLSSRPPQLSERIR